MNLDQVDLYPVITPAFCAGRSPLDVLEATLKGGAKMVQLRAKQESVKYAADFRRLTKQFGALLIINDDLELALQVEADGVHLGQADLPVKQARQLSPDLIIGCSTHNLEEALQAEAAGASYINIGPIFATKTKAMEAVGLEAIKQIVPQVKIPFTVMGGINLSNLESVLQYGADKIAMVTGLSQNQDVEAVTKQIIAIIRRFKNENLA